MPRTRSQPPPFTSRQDALDGSLEMYDSTTSQLSQLIFGNKALGQDLSVDAQKRRCLASGGVQARLWSDFVSQGLHTECWEPWGQRAVQKGQGSSQNPPGIQGVKPILVGQAHKSFLLSCVVQKRYACPEEELL